MSLELLFDENFGRPIIKALGEFLVFHELAPRVDHLLNRFASEGDKDEEWIPKCAKEDWIVITADKGGRGYAKLPRICRQFGVRHILLVGQLVHRRQFEKVRAIIALWPQVLMTTDQPRGSRFKIKMAGDHPSLEFVPDRAT